LATLQFCDFLHKILPQTSFENQGALSWDSRCTEAESVWCSEDQTTPFLKNKENGLETRETPTSAEFN
jgi:hypothetical protein